MADYQQVKELVSRAQTYDEIETTLSEHILPLDEMIKLEDEVHQMYLRLIRAADNITFTRMVRRARNDRPRWLQLKSLDAVVREEIDMRMLLTR